MSTDSERLSRWRPGPGRLAQLLLGLWLFGIGEGLIVLAGLGNSPWTVLAQGVSIQTPLSIGELRSGPFSIAFQSITGREISVDKSEPRILAVGLLEPHDRLVGMRLEQIYDPHSSVP